MALRMGKAPGIPMVKIHGRKPLPPAARRALPALAVLPFLDLRETGQDRHLAEGIAEEVLQALNQVEGLRVFSRTTTFPLGGPDFSLVEAGRRLKADAVLGGSLRKEGGLLILRTELIDVRSTRLLWFKIYEFERRQLFPTLEDIIRRVASALELEARVMPRRSVDLEAYECYLRGRTHFYWYNRRGMALAGQMFKQALDIDPGFASAWAGLANCAAYAYIYLERAESQRELAEEASRKALELDPTLAEAHASRGVALSAAGLAEEAESAFEAALCLDPNLYEAAYFYARHCLAAGKQERAIEYFEWAAALRPEDFQAVLLVAQVYHSLGLEDEAERARRQGLALVERRLEQVPGDVRARYLGANALVALGEREKGLAWAQMARRMDPEDPMLLYNLGCIHALAGDPGEALVCLRLAVTAGLTQKEWLLHDGDLDSLRAEAGFRSLIAALEEQQVARPDP
ncbi:MAG: tetratricopeptide repeat protein [Holophagaceae bacterium]|uniref:Tetratricopeptide repeat protein n=1 Tax=Candidatus Geothrix skivensis TaxID=2954439 RepID=A0A9D7SGP0_9BACT|nr:tetratricopeptide repeat protein [Candidatus Geothrix skivensis]